MNEIRKYYKLIVLILTLFPAMLFSQSILDSVNYHIVYLNSERNRKEVQFNLQKDHSLSNYYRGSYLFIHDELKDQLDSLKFFGWYSWALEKVPHKQFLELIQNYTISQAVLASKIEEVNTLGKLTKTPGDDLHSPYQIFSDWQLRQYHFSIQEIYALNKGFVQSDQSSLKKIYDGVSAEIEHELNKRGLYQSGGRHTTPLLQKRFELISALNQLATKEAIHLVDNSPLIIETRGELIKYTQELINVEEKLGNRIAQIDKGGNSLFLTRQYLTESTILERLKILNDGLRNVQSKHKIVFHYDGVIQLHIDNLNAQIAQEKSYLYFEKNHQAVLKGLKIRGPPDDPGPRRFNETPYPRPPAGSGGPGDITLDNFLSESEFYKIEKKSQKTLKRAIEREYSKFKTLNLEKPEWQQVDKYRRKLSFSERSINTFNYLKFLSSRYYQNLTIDPAEAAICKANFEGAIDHIPSGNVNKPSPINFIENDPILLARLEKALSNAIDYKSTRITKLGDYAPPWLEQEVKDLRKERNKIQEARAKINKNLKAGITPTRPPPILKNWLWRAPKYITSEFQNESFQLELLKKERSELQKVKTKYGLSAPPSIGTRTAQIDNLILGNEMCKTLKAFQDYSKDAAYIKLWENILANRKEGGLGSELAPLISKKESLQEIKKTEQIIKSGLDNAVKYQQRIITQMSLPIELVSEVSKARRTLKGQRKSAESLKNNRYRANQDLQKIKTMTKTNMKDPGGIWLSPNNIKIPPTSLFFGEDLWYYKEGFGGCLYGYDSWDVSTESDDIICIRKNHAGPPLNHWTKTITPW
jgi:hypothetical protein